MKITRVYYRIWLPDSAQQQRRKSSVAQFGTTPLNERSARTGGTSRCLRLLLFAVLIPSVMFFLPLYRRRIANAPKEFSLTAADTRSVDAAISTCWCQGTVVLGDSGFSTYVADGVEVALRSETVSVARKQHVWLNDTSITQLWSLYLRREALISVAACVSGSGVSLLVVRVPQSLQDKCNISAPFEPTDKPTEPPATLGVNRTTSSIDWRLNAAAAREEPTGANCSVIAAHRLEPCGGDSAAGAILEPVPRDGHYRLLAVRARPSTAGRAMLPLRLRFSLGVRRRVRSVRGAKRVCGTTAARCAVPLRFGSSQRVLVHIPSGVARWSHRYTVQTRCVPRTSLVAACISTAIFSIIMSAFL